MTDRTPEAEHRLPAAHSQGFAHVRVMTTPAYFEAELIAERGSGLPLAAVTDGISVENGSSLVEPASE
jgi:hypothetical protein